MKYDVVFFHPKNDLSGSTRVLANLIEEECKNKAVAIVTINNGIGFLSNLNVKIYRISHPLFRGKSVPVITSLVWRIHAILLALVVGARGKLFYINTILPYYAAIVGEAYKKNIVYHVHEKSVMRDKDYVIAEFVFNHTRAQKIFVSNYLKGMYPMQTKGNSIVKYNYLPKSFTDNVEIIPINQRNRNTIIMISSLSKAKGVFTFLSISKKLPKLKFILVVSADRQSILNFLGNDVPANLYIVGNVCDVHPYYRKSDLLLNLSVPYLCVETFGMTILEAMSYGIPAIVPNVGGPTELIENGYNGYCVDTTSLEDVIDKIVSCLYEREYMRLSQNSIDRYTLLFKKK